MYVSRVDSSVSAFSLSFSPLWLFISLSLITLDTRVFPVALALSIFNKQFTLTYIYPRPTDIDRSLSEDH